METGDRTGSIIDAITAGTPVITAVMHAMIAETSAKTEFGVIVRAT
jgi:hypothetical protein